MIEQDPQQQRENRSVKLEKEIEKLKKAIKTQRYGLVWLDVPEGFENDVENKVPILEEVPKKAIKSKDKKPTHLLIEGDNYHALTCLSYTHKNKIDVIYIDPPYNTGQDGFRYRDKRTLEQYPDGTEVPKDHPFRHSYWLSFMRKRLALAKDTLKESGVIFVSIDIHELAQLKLLMDDIFGESNLVSLISVKVKDPAGVGQQSFVFDVSEYILMYAKNISAFKHVHKELPVDFQPLTQKSPRYKKIVLNFGKQKFVKKIFRPIVGEIKIYKCTGYSVGKTTDLTLKGYTKKRNKIFVDYNPGGGMIKAIKDEIPKRGLSFLEYRSTKGRNANEVTKLYFLNGRIVSWLSDVTHFDKGQLYKKTKMINIWNVPNASLYLEGGVPFTNGKKPLRLVKKLLSMFQIKNAIVLDFFAGSGTTGEAVMSINEEDKLDRQFILVTNDDEITNGRRQKIMTDVCYPRIKNAIKGYNNRKALGNSIRYYKTGFVGKHNTLHADDKDKIQLAHHAGEMLAIAENTLKQVRKNDYWQLFESKDQMTAVYFREEQDQLDEFIEEVITLQKPVAAYIFTWQERVDVADFEGDKNITLKSIPQPILEIYKQIYNIV